jgi:hypothetical protein
MKENIIFLRTFIFQQLFSNLKYTCVCKLQICKIYLKLPGWYRHNPMDVIYLSAETENINFHPKHSGLFLYRNLGTPQSNKLCPNLFSNYDFEHMSSSPESIKDLMMHKMWLIMCLQDRKKQWNEQKKSFFCVCM